MEFLYTRQQMEGFKGYQSKVKIGNWSEDMELEAAKLKNYLMKKERGLLKCSQVRHTFFRVYVHGHVRSAARRMPSFRAFVRDNVSDSEPH